jgi:hypothetical protein
LAPKKIKISSGRTPARTPLPAGASSDVYIIPNLSSSGSRSGRFGRSMGGAALTCIEKLR